MALAPGNYIHIEHLPGDKQASAAGATCLELSVSQPCEEENSLHKQKNFTSQILEVKIPSNKEILNVFLPSTNIKNALQMLNVLVDKYCDLFQMFIITLSL